MKYVNLFLVTRVLTKMDMAKITSYVKLIKRPF